MPYPRCLRTLGACALFAAAGNFPAHAQEIKTVFVVAMENHNWTQPANQFTGGIQQVYQNPNAPFINSLVNGTAYAVIDGSVVRISEQVAYATAYTNVLATASGNNPHIHPSEPNYIWAEAGTNFGVLNDNDPYTGGTNQNTNQHLVAFLTQAGKTWKSYQEDIDLTVDGAGKLTNVPLPQDQWTVPLTSHSGVFDAGTFNAYNGSSQFNYAAKHNPMVFFTDSNGGNDSTPANPLSSHYAPLQQFLTDLQNNTVADYNWITPNQYNDMHSTLTGGYKGLAGDAANIKQGEDDLNHTVGEIVISKRAHENVNGLPYASPIAFTHSSDVRTMQNIFHAGPYIADAANANDLSDLFQQGAVPKKP